MERFLKEEYDSYSLVREKRKLDPEAQKVIATLHAKYYKHTFYKPCSCSGKTWQQWVSQLNDIYERGY